MDEAQVHPLRHQAGLALRHRLQQCQIRLGLPQQRRVVALQRVVGQPAQALDIAASGKKLEAADPDVAGRHPRQHRPRQRQFALHRFAGSRHRQRACGRHAQRLHGLADQHLAQHRAERGLAVAAA